MDKENPQRPEDEEFMADTKAAFLNRPTRLASGILYVLCALCIFLIIWAYFGKIDQITVGEGKVIPFSEVKVIQSLDGGIVKEILVDEGNIVQPNQVLAKLDATRYSADYSTGFEKYLALSATVARLTAEAQGSDHIDFPDEIKARPDLVTREINLFETRREALRGELNNLQKAYEAADKEVAMYPGLLEKGYVSKVQYVRAQQNAYTTKQQYLEKKNKFRESVLAELNQNKADLAGISEQLISLRDKMTHTTLRSPVYGIVKKINVHTEGGVINPGMDIMEIVPLADSLLIQAEIKPTDIAFIHKGQVATVKITAYDFSIFGSLPGIVEYVSPDAIEEAKQGTLPPKTYYLVNIRTNKSYFGKDNNKLPIIPGMGAIVYIKTGQKTIMDYLLKPLLKAKQEALRER